MSASRLIRVAIFAGLAAFGWCSYPTGVLAQAHRVQVPGLRQGQIHNPASARYVDMRPLGLARRQGGVAFRGGSTFTVPAWNRGWGWGTPAFGYGYHSSGITLGVGGAGLSFTSWGPGFVGDPWGPAFVDPWGPGWGGAPWAPGIVGVPWAPGVGPVFGGPWLRRRWGGPLWMPPLAVAPAGSPFVGAGPFMQPLVPWVPQVFAMPPAPVVGLPAAPPLFNPLIIGPGFARQNPPLDAAPAAAVPLRNPAMNDPLAQVEELAPVQGPVVRVSNAAARERADKFSAMGDKAFHDQSYRIAYSRYKSAHESAPDVLVHHLRLGQSLIAVGNYEYATRFYRKAISLGPAWGTTEFRLDDMYQGNRLVKTAHIDALAQALEAKPNDADLTLLVALQLLYDGQPDRARPFMERFVKLTRPAAAIVAANEAGGGPDPFLGGQAAPAAVAAEPVKGAPRPMPPGEREF